MYFICNKIVEDYKEIKAKLYQRVIFKSNGCHIYRRGLINKGRKKKLKYGHITYKKKRYPAYQVSYKAEQSEVVNIPNGYNISHLCHNTMCINKDHLSLEPIAVNNERKKCKKYCLGHQIGYPLCTV